ncbi:hypothetical protein IP88_14410 [alpha proteobacterium AAP81b]|nr:hypothetical protein IP88_14410 [alpha proteobacterium AAP81b]
MTPRPHPSPSWWQAMRRSTTLHFIVLHLVASLVTAGGVLLFTWATTDRLLVTELQDIVATDRDALVAAHAGGGAIAVRRRMLERGAAGGHRIFLIVDPGEQVVTGNLSGWPAALGGRERWQVRRLASAAGGTARGYGIATATLGDGGRLLVGHDLDDLERLQRQLEAAMALAALLAVPLGIGIAFLLTRLMNARIGAIAAVAARVAAGDLSRRIATLDGRDPFDRLGTALNAMLARIELLMTELWTLADSLAHDLRSPLGRIRSRAERLLARADDEESQHLLVDLLAETEALLKLLSATLEVSRAEAGVGRDGFEAVDLAALASDLAEVYGPAAEDIGMHLDLDLPGSAVTIAGSPQLLAQALANLIENALRYGRAGGSIRLAVAVAPDHATLSVADRGPGIPAERRAEALRKFGRLDPARSEGGVGLGLTLVAAVARLHGGALRLEDNAPGLRAVLILARG